MATNRTFGEILRLARERAGIDINVVARELRIRADILTAIEESDFSHMPPHGYTRNMVNAYARFLGLNASELTRAYLHDVRNYELRSVNKDTSKHSFNLVRSNRRDTEVKRSFSRDDSAVLSSRRHSDRTERERLRSYRTTSHNTSHNERRVRSTGSTRLRDQRTSTRTSTSRRTSLPASRYTSFYTSQKSPLHDTGLKLPAILVAIILLLIIVVLVLLFGRNGSDSSSDNVPNVPITGLTDTTNSSEDSDSSDGSSTLVAPTSVTVSYAVTADTAPWIEVYQDDVTIVAQIVSGPAEESYEVTGTLTIATAQPDNVTITVDDEVVEMTDDDGDSMYTYTFDFSTYLEEWNAANAISDDESLEASSE